MRAHLGNVALKIGDLALDVHGRPVFRLQPVGVTHLPCHAHAVKYCHTCELLRLAAGVWERPVHHVLHHSLGVSICPLLVGGGVPAAKSAIS